jgi:hypothetical protein
MKLKHMLAAIGLVAGTLGSMAAHAGVVAVWGEVRSDNSLERISNFYSGTAGNTSSVVAGQLDTVNLAGVNLLWAVQPADAYTAAELTAMAGFLSGGGRIAFMGEHGSFAPDENLRINAALTYLGVNVQIVNTIVDSGFRSASVADGQIKAHPLTTGVNFYQYAAFAPLTVGAGAETLMTGEDNTSDVMMAYQNVGRGSVFLITDQNVFDNAPNWSGNFNNARMFENLLSGNTNNPNNPIPEPTSLALVALALAGAAAARRRKA